MHKAALFTVAAALILVGLGSWAASRTQPRIDTPTNAQIDVLQIMTHAGNLHTDRIADYSVVFD
jgi:undecaprenyl pyrophosphate synthase